MSTENQAKITSYLNKKNGPNHTEKPVPSVFRTYVPSRENSDVDTEKLSEDGDIEVRPLFPGNRNYCGLYYLINPDHLSDFKPTRQELESLAIEPTKKNVLHFIRKQIQKRIKAHKIDSIKLGNLENSLSSNFWEHAVPTMVKRAAKGPMRPTKLLPSGVNAVVTLTKAQVFEILIHMFLCTMPEQFYQEDTTFAYLYNGDGYKSIERGEKLKCIGAYFEAVTTLSQADLLANIIYQRIAKPAQKIKHESKRMCQINLTYRYIQQHKQDLMVDFANKSVGGGVLKNGCVQQEILFITHPQLLISGLLYEQLEDSECGLVHGCGQYANYSGYSYTFKFTGKHTEKKELDSFEKLSRTFVVIDAMDYSSGIYKSVPEAQYTEREISREINKAYVGFSNTDYIDESEKKKSIATGRWGCGAFAGDPQLKMVIQWLACSLADRNMIFVNWNEQKQNQKATDLEEIIAALKDKQTTEVREILKQYSMFRQKTKIGLALVDYICDFYLL